VLSGVSIDKDDELAINAYFQCHLRQLGMGEEFVDESNGKVLHLLQKYPDSIGDILFAIGYSHMSQLHSTSIVPTLTRKSRTLARLRSYEDVVNDIEPILMLAIGLSALAVSTNSKLQRSD
jgi:hypothetical protein